MESEFDNANRASNAYDDSEDFSEVSSEHPDQVEFNAPVQYSRHQAMLELRVLSKVFQSDYRSVGSSSKQYQDRNLMYVLLIGDQITKTWSAGDRAWEDDFVMLDD